MTYEFNPSSVLRRPVGGLVFDRVATDRLEGPCALVEGLAAALGHFVLRPPAQVEGAQHGDVDAEAGEHEFDAAEHEGREGGAG